MNVTCSKMVSVGPLAGLPQGPVAQPQLESQYRKQHDSAIFKLADHNAPFLNLPLDVLVQILSVAHPLDIYKLSRTCRSLNFFFDSPRAAAIWERAWKGLVNSARVVHISRLTAIRNWPTSQQCVPWPDLSRIFFDGTCFVCRGKVEAWYPFRLCGARLALLCSRCCPAESLMSRLDIEKRYAGVDLPIRFFDALPTATIVIGQMGSRSFQPDVCDAFLQEYMAQGTVSEGEDAARFEWLTSRSTEHHQRAQFAASALTPLRSHSPGFKWNNLRCHSNYCPPDKFAMLDLEDKNLAEFMRRAADELGVPLIISDVLDAKSVNTSVRKLYMPFTEADWQRKPENCLKEVTDVYNIRKHLDGLASFGTDNAGKDRKARASSLWSRLHATGYSLQVMALGVQPNLAGFIGLKAASDIVDNPEVVIAEIQYADLKGLFTAVSEFSEELKRACIAKINSSPPDEKVTFDSIFALFRCQGNQLLPEYAPCRVKTQCANEILQHSCLTTNRIDLRLKQMPNTLKYAKQHGLIPKNGTVGGSDMIRRDLSHFTPDLQAMDNAKILRQLIEDEGLGCLWSWYDTEDFEFSCDRFGCGLMSFEAALEHMRKYPIVKRTEEDVLKQRFSSDVDHGELTAQARPEPDSEEEREAEEDDEIARMAELDFEDYEDMMMTYQDEHETYGMEWPPSWGGWG